MKERLKKIISEFEALQPRDFNLDYEGACGMETLDSLADELIANASPEIIAQTLLAFTERLSNTTEIDPRFDLGTPGPIVHTLEKLPGYQQYLMESLARFPTPLTVWMVNRILNVSEKNIDRERWLDVLRKISNDQNMSEITKRSAQKILNFQLKNQ